MRSQWSLLALFVAFSSFAGCESGSSTLAEDERESSQDDATGAGRERSDAGRSTSNAGGNMADDRSPRSDAAPAAPDATPRGDAAAPDGSGRKDAAAPSQGDASAAEPSQPNVRDGGAQADAAAGGKLPSVTSTASDGPFKAMQDLRSGPQGKSGLFRPTELGRDGVKHPLFVWGCGGGSNPMSYADILSKVATHGFIVIAEVSAIGDNGAPLRAAIEWILAENGRSDSALFGVVDTAKIALGGHSIGSVNAFYIGDDPRLTTTIHVAGGSLDNVRDPSAPTTGMGGKKLVHPVAYICSMSDTFGNVQKTQKDYDNTKAPAWMTVMTGVEHVGAARSGLPAIIAWLRWHLAGESERRGAFLDGGGEFSSGIFVSRSKNW